MNNKLKIKNNIKIINLNNYILYEYNINKEDLNKDSQILNYFNKELKEKKDYKLSSKNRKSSYIFSDFL